MLGFWRALFCCNTRFEIRTFALSPMIYQNYSCANMSHEYKWICKLKTLVTHGLNTKKGTFSANSTIDSVISFNIMYHDNESYNKFRTEIIENMLQCFVFLNL